MSAEEQTQDPHDNAFGAAADRDVNIVGSLDGKGVTDEGLSDEPTRHPRGEKRPNQRVPRLGMKRAQRRPHRIARKTHRRDRCLQFAVRLETDRALRTWRGAKRPLDKMRAS